MYLIAVFQILAVITLAQAQEDPARTQIICEAFCGLRSDFFTGTDKKPVYLSSSFDLKAPGSVRSLDSTRSSAWAQIVAECSKKVHAPAVKTHYGRNTVVPLRPLSTDPNGKIFWVQATPIESCAKD